MYYYELHEGADDIFSDVLLAREEEMTADIFFATVQEIRRRVQDTFEQETLIEAIAEELERDYDFVFISDDRLVAAVNVSTDEQENFLADLEQRGDGEAEDEEGELDEESDEEADFRTAIVELRPDGSERPN